MNDIRNRYHQETPHLRTVLVEEERKTRLNEDVKPCHPDARTSRKAFTLMELLPVIVLMGVFFLVAGPLMLHLIFANGLRTKTYDQVFLISQASDRIRSDLYGKPGRPAGRVLAVEPHRLRIESGKRTIEYRTVESQIERIETTAGVALDSDVYNIPYADLTFSRQSGRPGAALVGLHWTMTRLNRLKAATRKIPVSMYFAAGELTNQASNLEGR